MASQTLRDRIRARRERLQDRVEENIEETRQDPPRGKKKRKKKDESEKIDEASMETWGAAMETLQRLSGSELSDQEMVDEIHNAEHLVEDLASKHKARQRELAQSLKKKDDVKDALSSAKFKSKQKLEASLRERERAEVEEEVIVPQRQEEVAEGVISRLDEGILEDIPPDETAEEVGEGAPKPSPKGKGTKPAVSLSDAVKEAKEKKLAGTAPQKSTSLNASIRERLRDKVKNAREKAETEAQKELRPGRRLRGLRDKQLTTRFDDAAVEEKALSLRKKWKDTISKVTPSEKEKRDGVSAEEAYDFFCRNWDPEPDEEKKEGEAEEGEPKPGTSREIVEEGGEKPAATKEEDGGKEEEKNGKKAKTEEEELLLPDDVDEEGWGYTAIRRAEYIPYGETIKKENEAYYVPSMVSVPINKKIEENLQPRYLEDEGLYVGTRPTVSRRNENKLEDRLIHQADGSGKKWFGEDGRIQTLPDPLKETPSRAPVAEVPEPMLEAFYIKAIVADYDHRFIDGQTGLTSNYQIDLDINTLTFTHHHLFSREHVLVARLTHLYNDYLFRSKKNVVDFLTEKLRALKVATEHVRNAIAAQRVHGYGENGSFADQRRRLQDYKAEIKQTRQYRDTEEEADRNLMKNIIKTWKEIKSLRSMQRCNNTSAKLQIKKESTDRHEDEQNWRQEIEDEVGELREEHDEEYKKAQLAYNEDMVKYRAQQQAKREADDRQRARDSSQGNMVEDDQEAELRDLKILNEENLPEPIPPERFDLGNVKERVEAKAFRIRRRPGEPKLFPELTQSVTVTPKNQCPRGEQQRRDAVDRCKMFVKVLFNDKEVSRTVSRNLGQEFKVSFAQIFNIQIVQWPETIKLEVYEVSGFNVEKIANMYVAIPEASTTTDNVQLEDLDFSGDQIISHSHEGVGSGILFTFEADGSNMISLNTTGELKCGACWALSEDGVPMVPPSNTEASAYSAFKKFDAVQAIGASGMIDLDKISKWIASARLDPNDPSNADLVYLMKPMGGSDGMGMDGKLRIPEYFRLEQLQEEFNFATDEEMDTNLRFRLLMYRDQEIQEFRNYRQVPALDREIPADIFLEYEKKLKEEERKSRRRDIESHRAAVTRFMERVREQVLQRFRILSHQKQFSDMVYEEEVPQIGTLLPTLLKLAEVRRPLKPVRKERKKVTAQTLAGIDVKILVNIVRAYDVPVRNDSMGGGEGARKERRPRQITDLVRPYIEVMFQKETYCTSVADGPNPSWNEELQLSFHAPNNDYSTSNLQTVKDVIYFNLFDEVLIDVLEDDRDRATNIHRRIEKKWLGSLRIPFSTLYLNSKIEGTFRLDMPPVLLGYIHDSRTNRIDTGLGPAVEVVMSEEDQTFLTMFVTIEPQLSPPEPFSEKFDTSEDEKLLEAAENWQTELEKKYSKRQFRTTVTDINGKTVFITRYFKAIKPPDEILSKSSSSTGTSELIARYVALIPFVSDSVVFPGLCDIWSTCDQFMRMLAGDEEEHAVLLTNYFLSSGKKAWLLLGNAVPEGSTAYVLTEEDNDFWIWNASNGQHFSYRDNYCPLQAVGCVINDENIWANIQEYAQPSRLDFDISNSKKWKPFFTSRFPNPGLSSIQPDHLDYFPTEKAYVGDLQDKLERTLREKIMEWRPRHVTRWNRYCMQAFRQLLIKFEEAGGKSMRDKSFTELEQILQTYKMSGFPLNMPFTEIEPVVDAVYSTGVHENEAKNVEFALAVYIHPYPNSILSVWVYVASLTRKK